jgi:cytidylate kinase
MAGRPRVYANAAEKTRAYRERIAEQNKGMTRVYTEWYERTQTDKRRLISAVSVAQRRKDPLALSLRTRTIEVLVEDLVQYFQTGEIAPAPIITRRTKKAE